jgi:4'-phosphopantetheinyl transferase
MNQNYNDLTFSLNPDEVHVWIFDLTHQQISTTYLIQFLSQEEQRKANSYKFDGDKQLFLARRGILRKLIARYIGLDEADIRYSENPYGKIFIPGHRLNFNISHSQKKIALAFTLNKDIGVDIEQVRPLPDFPQLVDRWVSKKEKDGLLQLPIASQLEAFFHVWTQKEAFIKTEGKGLVDSLQDFSVSVDPTKPAKLIENKNSNSNIWKIESFIPEPNWRVAVCIKAKRKQKVLWFAPIALLP